MTNLVLQHLEVNSQILAHETECEYKSKLEYLKELDRKNTKWSYTKFSPEIFIIEYLIKEKKYYIVDIDSYLDAKGTIGLTTDTPYHEVSLDIQHKLPCTESKHTYIRIPFEHSKFIPSEIANVLGSFQLYETIKRWGYMIYSLDLQDKELAEKLYYSQMWNRLFDKIPSKSGD